MMSFLADLSASDSSDVKREANEYAWESLRTARLRRFQLLLGRTNEGWISPGSSRAGFGVILGGWSVVRFVPFGSGSHLVFFWSRSLEGRVVRARRCLLGGLVMVEVVLFSVVSVRCLRRTGREYTYVG